MKFDNRDSLKKEAIKLYLSGNNFSQIAEKLDCSRAFITNLIKEDSRVKEKRNTAILKVYKNAKNKKMRLGLSTEFLTKIGIDRDCSKIDYVDVVLDEEKEQIIIKKHNL